MANIEYQLDEKWWIERNDKFEDASLLQNSSKPSLELTFVALFRHFLFSTLLRSNYQSLQKLRESRSSSDTKTSISNSPVEQPPSFPSSQEKAVENHLSGGMTSPVWEAEHRVYLSLKKVDEAREESSQWRGKLVSHFETLFETLKAFWKSFVNFSSPYLPLFPHLWTYATLSSLPISNLLYWKSPRFPQRPKPCSWRRARLKDWNLLSGMQCGALGLSRDSVSDPWSENDPRRNCMKRCDFYTFSLQLKP